MDVLSSVRGALARAGTSPADVVLAVVIASLVLAELVSDDSAQSPAVIAATALALSTIAWRRRAPTAVAVAALLAALLLAMTAEGEFPPQLPFLAVLVVVYTAAAHLGGRRAALAGAVTLVLVTAAHLVTADGDAGDFLPWLVWGAPWAAGRLVRRRTQEAAAAAARAALLVQHRDEQVREAAARERDRIARELHDVVAHGVSLIVVQAGAERLRLGDDAPRTRAVLDDIERAGRTALSELRTMLGVLRATAADDCGLEASRAPLPGLAEVAGLVDRVRGAGLPVTLRTGPPFDVAPGVGRSAYRIVQEALTNVLKHAPGARTTVTIGPRDDVLVVEVRNVLSADAPSPATGLGRGLAGMAERAALHGGRVRHGPDHGDWTVRAELPLARDQVPA